MDQLQFSDWLGLAGIAISLLGFAVSFWQLRKTKGAAESATKAASDAKDAIRHLNALLEFKSLANAVDEILEAIREKRIDRLQSLIGTVRKSMIAARETHTSLTDAQSEKIESSLVFLSNLEIRFETTSFENEMSKRKIMKTMIEISNIATEVLSNPHIRE